MVFFIALEALILRPRRAARTAHGRRAGIPFRRGLRGRARRAGTWRRRRGRARNRLRRGRSCLWRRTGWPGHARRGCCRRAYRRLTDFRRTADRRCRTALRFDPAHARRTGVTRRRSAHLRGFWCQAARRSPALLRAGTWRLDPGAVWCRRCANACSAAPRRATREAPLNPAFFRALTRPTDRWGGHCTRDRRGRLCSGGFRLHVPDAWRQAACPLAAYGRRNHRCRR
jgi:hypothetical protein